MRSLVLGVVAALLLPISPPASTSASTSAAAAAAAIAAREPDGLSVTGWILQSGSSRLVARNADGLSTLSVAGVSINRRGDDVARPTGDARRLARAAHRHRLDAELLLSNWSNRLEDFDPRALHRLLSHPARIRAVADRLASYVARGGWDGVNVDLERVRAGDRDGLVSLVTALQAAMPAERTVTVDVSARPSAAGYRSGGYDLAGLAGVVDRIELMTYDQHGPTWSGPGPVGGLAWQRRCLAALLDVVPAGQVDLGVAGYGYSWPRHGTGRTLTVARARQVVARDGVRAQWRAGAGEWTARLSNGTRIWWSDRRSFTRRAALARHHGLHGLAVWRLGSADTLG
jgi:spore germination protein YaaH